MTFVEFLNKLKPKKEAWAAVESNNSIISNQLEGIAEYNRGKRKIKETIDLINISFN